MGDGLYATKSPLGPACRLLCISSADIYASQVHRLSDPLLVVFPRLDYCGGSVEWEKRVE